MALGDVISRLSVVLGMETAAFEKGADIAEKRLRQTSRDIEKLGKRIASTGKTLSASLTAPIAGLGFAFARTAAGMVEDSRDMQRAALAAGDSFESFQRDAFAASTVGVEFGKLGDIFRDVTDKVGDFRATGGGELADFFENIAPQVGLTADAFKDLSGKEGLQLYYNALRQANVSSDEMTFYLEAIASDATDLIPLLEENGRQFDELGRKAAVIGDEDAEGLKRYAEASKGLEQSWRKLTIAIVNSGVLEVIVDLVGKAGDLAARLSEINPQILRWGVAIAAVGAAVGPVVIGIGGLVQVLAPLLGLLKTVGGFMAATGTASGAATAGLAAFKAGAASLLSALGPVSLAVGAVAAAAVVIYRNWDKIAPVLEKAGARIREVLGPKVQRLIETVTEKFRLLWEGPLGEGIRAAAAAFLEFQTVVNGFLGDAFLRLLGAAAEAVTGSVALILDGLRLVVNLLSGDFSGAWEAAKDIAANAVRTVLGVLNALAPGATEAMRQLYVGVKQWLQDRLGAVFDWVQDKVSAVNDSFAWLYDQVVGNSHVPDMVDGIADQMARLDGVMVRPAQKATGDVNASMRDMARETKAILDRLFPQIAQLREYRADLATIEGSDLPGNVKGGARRALRYELAGVDPGVKSPITVFSDEDQREFERAMDRTMERIGRDLGKHGAKIRTATVRIAESFRDMANRTIDAVQNMVGAIKGGGFLDILGSVIGLGLQLASIGVFGKGAAKTVNSVPTIPGFANGTSFAPGGLALVGERGPELVDLPRGARVTPNNALGGLTQVRIVPSPYFDAVVDERIGAAAPALVDAGGRAGASRVYQRQGRRL